MAAWVMNLDFAASGTTSTAVPAEAGSTGSYLLVGAGCWAALLAAAAWLLRAG